MESMLDMESVFSQVTEELELELEQTETKAERGLVRQEFLAEIKERATEWFDEKFADIHSHA